MKNEIFEELKGMKFVKNTQYKINEYIRLKIEKMVINYLEKQPPKIKRALKDPDMCMCV